MSGYEDNLLPVCPECNWSSKNDSAGWKIVSGRGIQGQPFTTCYLHSDIALAHMNKYDNIRHYRLCDLGPATVNVERISKIYCAQCGFKALDSLFQVLVNYIEAFLAGKIA